MVGSLCANIEKHLKLSHLKEEEGELSSASNFSIFGEFCKNFYAKYRGRVVHLSDFSCKKVFITFDVIEKLGYELNEFGEKEGIYSKERFRKIVQTTELIPMLSGGDLVFVFDSMSQCYILTEIQDVKEDSSIVSFNIEKTYNPDGTFVLLKLPFCIKVDKEKAFEDILIVRKNPKILLKEIASLAHEIPSPYEPECKVTAYRFRRLN